MNSAFSVLLQILIALTCVCTLDAQSSCTFDHHCPRGQYCRSGSCQNGCFTSNNCPSGTTCVARSCMNSCVPSRCASGRCHSSTACAPDTVNGGGGTRQSDDDIEVGGLRTKPPSGETPSGKTKGGIFFHGSTLVRLGEGTTKPISQIKEGDKVASVNDRGEPEIR